MLTHYNSSKGAKEIATMPLPYAKNALAKLHRDEPERTAEIEALTAHVERLEAEAAESDTGTPVRDGPAPMGDNNPPADEAAPNPKAWEAIKITLDDLLSEAAGWADGAAIETEGQAKDIGKLRGMLQQAMDDAEKARVAEKKPLDEQIAEIQNRYNEYIAPMKNKVPGRASKAIAALGNTLSVWMRKKDEELRSREREAAAAAAKAAQEAIDARKEAQASTDLAEMDKAEVKLADAEALFRQAKAAAKEKAFVGGEDGLRKQSLRATYIAEPSPEEGAMKAALIHYWAERREDMIAVIQGYASADARDPGKRARGIPGFVIREEKGL